MEGYGSSSSLSTQRYLTGDTMENHEEPGRIAGNKVNFAPKMLYGSAAVQGIHQDSHIINLELTAVLIKTVTTAF